MFDVNLRLPELIEQGEFEATDSASTYTCELDATASLRDFRIAGAQAARDNKDKQELLLQGLQGHVAEAQQNFFEAFFLASYQQPRVGLSAGEPRNSEIIYYSGVPRAIVCRAKRRAEATFLARDLTNIPSSTKNPEWMAQQVQELSNIDGVTVEVKDYKTLQEEGFGGICAVGQGSKTPPCLIHISYEPEETSEKIPHYALIGKGITFDTGGVNLKPAEGMSTMKTDMQGSAIVFAVTRAVAQMQLPVKIDCLMAMAENAIGGASYRPSDVIKMYSGETVEVVNTDAEGRMVLADALSFADQELHPDFMIDVATLTGAASLSVGKEHAAFYSNDETLAEGLIESGDITGEYLWRMPLPPEYREMLNTPQADILQAEYNAGGGSIFAALFLQNFAGSTPWAHLDIAGPGRWEKDYNEFVTGATGFGTRALIHYFESIALK